MSICESGLSIDHAQPSTERRYLARNSRSVRFHNRLRERMISAT